jgi:hypothetical protein
MPHGAATTRRRNVHGPALRVERFFREPRSRRPYGFLAAGAKSSIALPIASPIK